LQALIGDQACVKIKWPNDIVVDDAKISGTLIESDNHGYYVGIGINLTAVPTQVMYPTVALGRFCEVERLSLINMVATTWLERFKSWVHDGFAPIAAAYTSRIWRHGQSITVALDEARTTRIEGRCLGISEAGLLLIALANGETRALSTGDVGL
jgi:BirA family transcriptional regulator, biotin operon repressor / biotin---[acetyl-CoA-carboxylase] ligase